MKKTIILSIIIFLLLGLLLGTAYYEFIYSSDKNIYSKCSLNVTSTESQETIIEYELTSEQDGTLTSIDKTVKNYYTDDDAYNAAKEYYQDQEGYELDDIEKVVTQIENIDLLDENGNKKEIWYKSYIENLKDLNYVCE